MINLGKLHDLDGWDPAFEVIFMLHGLITKRAAGSLSCLIMDSITNSAAVIVLWPKIIAITGTLRKSPKIKR